MRLVGGSNDAEGRVEIYYSGIWGTVCDDEWNEEESLVLCRQLGYLGPSLTLGEGDFPSGSGPIWLDDVQCDGSEASISSCSHSGWGNHNCYHYEDVGVRCYTDNDVGKSDQTEENAGT